MEKDIDKRLVPLETTSMGMLKFGMWAKSDELKILKNCCKRKCTAEFDELSSVANLFWANHASKKAQKNAKRKIIGWTNVLKKWIDYNQSFWRTEEEMAKKLPKYAKNVTFFRPLVDE